jgi:coatomer protein complex subunit epsilon
VLNTLLGKKEESQKLKSQLESAHSEHKAVADWAEKKQEFARAASKYSPQFEVAS